MNTSTSERRLTPGWCALILVVGIIALIATTTAIYAGVFNSYTTVFVTSPRAGLVMESGGKVKMRGIQVGRVAGVDPNGTGAQLKLELFEDQVPNIPANVGAQIRATTVFGAKYVDLIYPSDPDSRRIAAGAVLQSTNVSTEVQTVFQNLVDVFKRIDPPKLNAILTAVAEGVRGRGEQMGQAISDTNAVLIALNSRSEAIGQDWSSLRGFADTYGAAAHDLVAILDASAVTSSTITRQAHDLDTLLLNTVGFAHSGINLLGASRDDLVKGINTLEPTTALLDKYSPSYACLLQGAQRIADNSRNADDGRSTIVDMSLGWNADPYRYPENLPIIAAKGGPDGKPGCGSLPDVEKNWPQRYLVTDTGFGTGLDKRPNPGIAHPWWVNFFPVTRGMPEPPSIRGAGPPAIGPVPYPGAPPYGAPMYGPGGVPLYPGVPPAPGGQPAEPTP